MADLRAKIHGNVDVLTAMEKHVNCVKAGSAF